MKPFQSDLPAGRDRLLAVAAYHADACREIKTNGLDAALQYVKTLGGVTQPRTLARSMVAAIEKFGPVPESGVMLTRLAAPRVLPEEMLVAVHISWRFANRRSRSSRSRQVAAVEWIPLFKPNDPA